MYACLCWSSALVGAAGLSCLLSSVRGCPYPAEAILLPLAALLLRLLWVELSLLREVALRVLLVFA